MDLTTFSINEFLGMILFAPFILWFPFVVFEGLGSSFRDRFNRDEEEEEEEEEEENRNIFHHHYHYKA